MTAQNSNRPTSLPTNSSTNPLTAAQSQLRSYLHKRLRALVTEENALGTIAAAAFGALLYTVVTGGDITQALTDIIERALNTDV